MPELGPVLSPAPAPTAKAEPPKTGLKVLAAARGAYPFSILLSSCKEKPSALAAAAKFRKNGLTPYIVETDLGGRGLWWRILSGYYRTLEEASQARKALRIPDAVVVKTPYANLIGQYGSENDALLAAAQVTTKEVFPYVLRAPGNSFQLIAGAFPSQQAADKHQRELESKGIAARTIQR
jgi:cell division septation protein DedD